MDMDSGDEIFSRICSVLGPVLIIAGFYFGGFEREHVWILAGIGLLAYAISFWARQNERKKFGQPKEKAKKRTPTKRGHLRVVQKGER